MAERADDAENEHPAGAKWSWLEEPEQERLLAANGASVRDFMLAMESKNLFSTVRGKAGKPYKSFRTQITVKGQKLKVHNIKLWLTIHVARQQSCFDWEKFTQDVWHDCKDVKLAACKIKSAFEKISEAGLEDLLSSKLEKLRALADRQNELNKETEEHESDAQPAGDAEERAGPNVKHDLIKPFFACIVLGIGLNPSDVDSAFSTCGARDLSLEDRIREVRTKLQTKRSTFQQYLSLKNLFLLWLYSECPSKFREGGLIATENEAYRFCQALEAGDVGLSSQEPSIVEVLEGRASFVPQKTRTTLSYAYAKKYLSALNELFVHQQMLLNRDLPYLKLSDSVTLSNWKLNLLERENQRKDAEHLDVQRTVFSTECPLKDIEKQAIHLLHLISEVAVRNRALGLCQAFSVSRFDEIKRWRLGGMHMATCSERLPTMGEYEMKIVCFVQIIHKTGAANQIPDEKHCARRKEWTLCPQGALASYFFHRFVLRGEEPPDLAEPKGWQTVYVFRSTSGRFNGMCSSAVGAQRADVMDLTETGLAGVNHHYFRRVGSYLGTMHGLRHEDVQLLGLWNLTEMEKHYLKYMRPKIYARLSGFPSEREFDIPRSRLSVEHFLVQHPEADPAFFTMMMPWLDDPATEAKARAFKRRGKQENLHVLQTLRYLRTVFYQDLWDAYTQHSEHEIFSAEMFKTYEKTFKLWLQYSEQQINAFPPSSAAGRDDSDSKWRKAMERRTVELTQSHNAANAKLDRIVSLIQSGQPVQREGPAEKMGAPKKSVQTRSEAPAGHADVAGWANLSKLRPLHEMTYEDLVQEWTTGSEYQGIKLGPLFEFDRLRVARKIDYKESIKSSLLIRRNLFGLFRQRSLTMGSPTAAFRSLKALRETLGGGTECSLDHLYRRTQDKKRKRGQESLGDWAGEDSD